MTRTDEHSVADGGYSASDSNFSLSNVRDTSNVFDWRIKHQASLIFTMGYQDLANESHKNGFTKQITTEIVSFKNPEDSLIGKLLEISDFTGGKFDTSCKQYLFDTDTGLKTCLLGGATDKQLEKQDLKDKVLIIVFKGQDEIEGGRKVNKFDISVVVDPDEGK